MEGTEAIYNCLFLLCVKLFALFFNIKLTIRTKSYIFTIFLMRSVHGDIHMFP